LEDFDAVIIPSRRKKRVPNRQGVAAAELALLLPVLTILLVIAVDFSRIFYFYVTITNCARSGALYAADPTAPSQSQWASASVAALGDWPPNLMPAPTVTGPRNGTDAEGNSYVDITVTYTFKTVSGYLGAASTMTISRTVRARVQPLVPGG
jgi:Flp pilus assembly protein TadG